MTRRLSSLVITLGLALAAPAVLAANAETPRADKRQENQAKRIDQGVASGALTQREANRLQRRQDAIAQGEAAAKADGVVTASERRRLERAQDRNSARIAKQKHDRQHAPQ